ncbi:hypothetical protein [Lactococcus protaetiae]|uniref:Uncharacterized protein n=1 Tax=Lactococcus protaetiae TaxID=2592653 RepID=A0A514ZA58_9LACT|nr:hypothetical protein [Lactococcus protaetiae]QDK71472.1 hypothetical protein FLP15_10245 [Lactococcus protaetiae]
MKKELTVNNAPCGYSRIKHKKRIRKVDEFQLTPENVRSVGRGYANVVKAFIEGYQEVINERV